MKAKKEVMIYDAPIIWLLGLSQQEKDIAKQVLKSFEEAKQKFCVVDYSKKRINGNLTIDFKSINMSKKEGQPYYDHVFEQLTDMGFNVE